MANGNKTDVQECVSECDCGQAYAAEDIAVAGWNEVNACDVLTKLPVAHCASRSLHCPCLQAFTVIFSFLFLGFHTACG